MPVGALERGNEAVYATARGLSMPREAFFFHDDDGKHGSRPQRLPRLPLLPAACLLTRLPSLSLATQANLTQATFQPCLLLVAASVP